MNADEKKAILSTEDELIFEFFLGIEKIDKVGYEIFEFIPRDFHEYVDSYSDFSDDFPINNKYKLCYEIIEYINYLYIYPHLTQEEKEKNKKIIKQDKIFLNLLDRFKKEFDSYYNNFVEIK